MSKTAQNNDKNDNENEKKTEQVLINIDPATFQTLKQIAHRDDRPVGNVARNLMLRGLVQFNIDGKLRDPEMVGASA